ncbi:phosphotransferase [Phytoactinopolyspora alkaliphila]|uniref:Phosphotransferase n=1 Tax=Phytoactinopolyspora alkaliphila TaxID=1783498 RepID=A0A6N9YR78_9ACTN|nr:phosphotransferase [Phytoactinopolyspora alkaliphila]NED97435.1 phosphotransferase [Phytoactinopolyspora alkaliphila]
MRFDPRLTPADRTHVAELLAQPDFAFVTENASVAPLPGGASNRNFKVDDAGGPWVLRIAELGVDRFGIDRARGLAGHRAAAAAGLAPELAAVTLPEGHCAYRFVDGAVLDAERVRADGVIEALGQALYRMHDAGPVDGRWSAFDDIRAYLALAEREGLRLPQGMQALADSAAEVGAVFAASAIPDRLCHNDLQLQNVIVDGEQLRIIDWEYAGMGNPYFDLGGVCVNGELDSDEQDRLLLAYFGEVRPVDQARVALMAFVSAVREAAWAIIAKPVLTIDWDYDAWTDEYVDRAHRLRSSSRFAERLRLAT